MKKRKRHSAEQIVRKLREADAMLAGGASGGSCSLLSTGPGLSRTRTLSRRGLSLFQAAQRPEAPARSAARFPRERFGLV
jgi:hypothetical protein